MDLIGLNNYCERNLSGLVKIQYAPIDWIDASNFIPIVTASNNWQYNVLFSQGDWLTAPIFPKSGNWSENQNRSKQGKYYDKTVKGTLPNMKPDVVIELERMANHLYILKLEDTSGRFWIMGTLEQPFEFLADGTTGESGALKQHSIRFTAKTLRKAHGFLPVINT